MTDHCRSCGAEILWTTTMQGRRLPLDPEPHPQGNVLLTGSDGRVAVVLTRRQAGQRREHPRYRSHFVTCPHADVWRGRWTKQGKETHA